MQRTIMTQRQRMSDHDSSMRRFRSDLDECVQHIQDPAQLREELGRLYTLHVQQAVHTEGMDSAIHNEYERQRAYLEQSVHALKQRLSRDMAMHKSDNMRVMQENMGLIKEINELREQMRIACVCCARTPLLRRARAHPSLPTRPTPGSRAALPRRPLAENLPTTRGSPQSRGRR